MRTNRNADTTPINYTFQPCLPNGLAAGYHHELKAAGGEFFKAMDFRVRESVESGVLDLAGDTAG